MREHNRIQELLKVDTDCLTVEQLASLDSADLPVSDRARFEGHVAGCSRCEAEHRMLQAYESASETDDERIALAKITAGLERQRAAQWPVTAAPKASIWSRWFSVAPMHTWALVAASVLVVVAGSVYLRNLRAPGLSDVSGGEQIVRSATLVAIGPAGELPRAPEQFEWKAISSAQRYRVTVRDVSGDQLWSGESQVTSVAFPAALRTMLLPGKTLSWQVEALAEGKVLASSGPIRFVLRTQP